ncbi:MAG: alpha/beta fold hydrolase [Proteobacteria bacterium]|nr:alpha/beta fold hydrolase [Pseudomonadota bacterium]
MLNLALAFLLQAASPAPAWPTREADITLRDFHFASGERLGELRIHYTTLGQPHRNAKGDVDNAVMVLHGTGGTGKQFLSPQFANELYGPGQPLDIARYYIILPDGIGHGGSSKPSDGLRAKFPKYDYTDMVAAEAALLDRLGVKKLRLLMGTSMGCMHSFVWGTTRPSQVQAMMPMACLPVAIAGQNRMWRKMAIDAIRADPGYSDGNYTAQPMQGLRTATDLLILAGLNPVAAQAEAPTREKAEAMLAARFEATGKGRDGNDLIWQLDASRTYDPSAGLERMTMPVTWVNSADDAINPPGLGIAEREAKRLPNGRFILIPQSAETKGHGTHTWAKFWKSELVDLLKRSETP